MKSKAAIKEFQQLTEEGVAQLSRGMTEKKKFAKEQWVNCNFDVIQYGLLNEYGASCRFEHLIIIKHAWITADDEK